jgi:excinuclease UvrABC nuclease subunit
MMATFEEFEAAINELNTKYPRPGLTLTIRPRFDLRTQFAEQYPASEDPGVYALIADNGTQVLRIGKAKCLGRRLGNYFKWQNRNQGRGMAKQTVYDGVRYIVTVPLPVSRAFEVHSVEGFLLSKMRPSLNSMFELEAFEDVLADL